MTIKITAIHNSPDQGRGLGRDMRVRWALEEVGQRYEAQPVSFEEMKEAKHRSQNPFGQIPTYQDGELTLFESGAIVLHIGLHYAGLLPGDEIKRGRAMSWMFAALNTIEPTILELQNAKFAEGNKPWTSERLPLVFERIDARLSELSAVIAGDWLDGKFSLGDLMMISVLLRLKSSGLLNKHPKLASYVARGEQRPAYQRAFAAQLALYEATSG